MIIDQQNQFSNSQVLAGAGATPSTNIIDLSEFREIAEGETLGVMINVPAGAVAGDSTYQVQLQTYTDTTFGAAVNVFTQVLTAAQLALGANIFIPISNLVLTNEFLRLLYTLGGTAPGVTLSAVIQPKSMVDEPRYYKNNYTIVGH